MRGGCTSRRWSCALLMICLSIFALVALGDVHTPLRRWLGKVTHLHVFLVVFGVVTFWQLGYFALNQRQNCLDQVQRSVGIWRVIHRPGKDQRVFANLGSRALPEIKIYAVRHHGGGRPKARKLEPGREIRSRQGSEEPEDESELQQTLHSGARIGKCGV